MLGIWSGGPGRTRTYDSPVIREINEELKSVFLFINAESHNITFKNDRPRSTQQAATLQQIF